MGWFWQVLDPELAKSEVPEIQMGWFCQVLDPEMVRSEVPEIQMGWFYQVLDPRDGSDPDQDPRSTG